MNKKKIIFLMMLVILTTMSFVGTKVFAQKSPYQIILLRTEQWASEDETEALLEEIGDSPTVLSKVLQRGLLLFRNARYKDDEKLAREAYDYLDQIYQNNPQLNNPAMLVYLGASYAFIGGAIKKPQPSTKIKILNDGVAMIDRAIQQLGQEEDYFALGLAYLIRASTIVSVPPFLKVFREIKPTLKRAAYYFKRAGLSSTDEQNLLAGLYEVYAQHSLVSGNVSKAKKYLNSGIEKAQDARLKKFLQVSLENIK